METGRKVNATSLKEAICNQQTAAKAGRAIGICLPTTETGHQKAADQAYACPCSFFWNVCTCEDTGASSEYAYMFYILCLFGDFENDFADITVGFHMLLGFHRLSKREDRIDNRLDFALFHMRNHVFDKISG